MRILVTGCRGIPNVPGGVETHCQQLYPELVKLGCEVTVICRRGYVQPGLKSYRGVKLVSLFSLKIKGLEALLHTVFSIGYAFFKGYKLIHLHSIGPALAVPLARLLGIQVVLTHHGPDYVRRKWGRFSKWMLKLGEKTGVHRACRVIVISRTIKTALEKLYRRTDCILIPNGILIPARSRETDFITSLGLQPGHYCLAVCRFVPEKGLHDLVAAYRKINPRGMQLVLAGDDFQATSYATRLKTGARQAGCVLPGFVEGEALRQLYSHARAFILPSYIEGLSLSLLEAMAYGLEIVASSIPANREVDLEAEAFFPPGDVDRLAEKLQQVADNPGQKKPAYQKLVGEKYNWEKIAVDTLGVYKDVVQNV